MKDYGPHSQNDVRRAILCVVLLAALLSIPQGLTILKGVFFAQLLILAGTVDMKSREIPDELCALIFLLSLIHPKPAWSLIGALIVSFSLWIFGTVIHGSVGGADIKLIAACGAVLGPAGIVAGTEFSLIVYLIFLLIRFLLHRDREKKVAMAPWFGIGCFFAYLIEMNGG